MTHKTKNLIVTVTALSDMILVMTAWVLAYIIRFNTVIDAPSGVPEFLLYLKLLPFVMMIWLLVFSGTGLYSRAYSHRSAILESIDILKSCFYATLTFIAFTYFYEEYRYSRITLAIFAGIHPLMIIAGRSFIRKTIRLRRRKSQPETCLIIGNGNVFEHGLELVHASQFAPVKVVAMIMGQVCQEKVTNICERLKINLVPIPTDWPEYFHQNPTVRVIIALPHEDYPCLTEHLEQIAEQVTDVTLIPDILRFTRFAAGIDLIEGLPVIKLHESPLMGHGAMLKRLLDVIGSLLAIILFSPLMLAIAILIKLTSVGPIIFRQQRMGMDGKTFAMMKFRSMPINAEEKTGAIWAVHNDSRPTFLGGFLRRTSLDELPQFFNVLKGDMSLVGPRPERPVFVKDFRKKIPGYMLRHKVKAGITGWAQVHGWRGNTSLEKRIEHDLYYIQNWSLAMDVRILSLTFIKGFINKNAY